MTTAPHSAPPEQLIEDVHDWRAADLVVDREHRYVRNVALASTESKNGYRYRAEALAAAVPLYRNKPVFLDHARPSSRPFDRSTRDLVGSIVHPRFEAGRVRADIRVIDTEAGRTFLALAESNGPAVGMSHVVLARRSADRRVVEHLEDVVSVDAVVFPAATTTFRENHADPTDELERLREEVAALRQERDALLQQRTTTRPRSATRASRGNEITDAHLIAAIRRR